VCSVNCSATCNHGLLLSVHLPGFLDAEAVVAICFIEAGDSGYEDLGFGESRCCAGEE